MAEQMSWYGAGGRFRNKVYVGNLSSRTKETEIKEAFSHYGEVVDIVLKYDFAFVEMDNEKDMEEAIDALDQKEFNGRKWLVEPARRGPSRPVAFNNESSHYSSSRGGGGQYFTNPRESYGGGGGRGAYGGGGGGRGGAGYGLNRRPAGMRPARGEHRIQILGLSSATSWQDLKDWGRQAGESVCYGDVFVDGGRRMGIVEYNTKEDYVYAIKHLNGDKLHGKTLSVYKDGEAPPINLNEDGTMDQMNGNEGNENDNESVKSSPRLHENERHVTRRSYYGGSRAYGSSSNSHKKDIKSHAHSHGHGHKPHAHSHGHRARPHRHRSRRHRHTRSHSRSASASHSPSHSRSASTSRSRSRSRHRSRTRRDRMTHRHRRHRRSRRSRRRTHKNHEHGSRSVSSSKSRDGAHNRSRDGKEMKREEAVTTDGGVGVVGVTETELSGIKSKDGKQNEMDVDMDGSGGVGNGGKGKSRSRSASINSRSRSGSKSRSRS